MSDQKVWIGEVDKCNVCNTRIENYFVDGRTKFGPWACMCPACHCKDGVGLGTGKGQKYKRVDTDGFTSWVPQQ